MNDTLTLRTHDLVQSLQAVANEQNLEPEKLLDQAVAEFLDRMALGILQSETRAFQAMHESLVTKHLGDYVAIHNGKLVDHDLDLNSLRRRVRQKYGRIPLLLRQVTTDPSEPEFTIRSPRLLWSVQK